MSDNPESSEAGASQANGAPAEGKDGKKPELSGAEKKKLAKQEKAARRAKEKEGGAPGSRAGAAAEKDGDKQKSGDQPAQQQQQQQQRRTGSTSNASGSRQGQQHLPVRRRPSQSAPRDAAPAPTEKKPRQKQVPFLTHLYARPRRHTVDGASKDVHPAVLTLAQQIAHYSICGSHARTAATLLALKAVIATYATPPGTSLPRHLPTHFLSPQLTHLKAYGRPFCTAQSAAVRWLKNAIATLDPGLPEHEAKNSILAAIDTFVRDRLAVADAVIAAEVAEHWIRDADTLLVFGHSAVVARALREAARRGRTFHVLVADARPLHEGRALAASLRSLRRSRDTPEDDDDIADATAAEPAPRARPQRGAVQTTYVPLPSLPAALAAHPPSKVLLGAHTVLANGAVQARAGTALAALLGKQDAGAAVLVLAESVKFGERVAVDSLGGNELAPEDELAAPALHGWQADDRLALLNPIYDVTPPELVDAVVTELGTLPPGAAPAVSRMVGGVGESVF